MVTATSEEVPDRLAHVFGLCVHDLCDRFQIVVVVTAVWLVQYVFEFQPVDVFRVVALVDLNQRDHLVSQPREHKTSVVSTHGRIRQTLHLCLCQRPCALRHMLSPPLRLLDPLDAVDRVFEDVAAVEHLGLVVLRESPVDERDRLHNGRLVDLGPEEREKRMKVAVDQENHRRQRSLAGPLGVALLDGLGEAVRLVLVAPKRLIAVPVLPVLRFDFFIRTPRNSL